MPQNDKMLVHVTRKNLDWVVEFTGLSREKILTELEIAEAKDLVCVLEIRSDGEVISIRDR